MGKGKRAHIDYSPPLSSASLTGQKVYESPPLYTNPVQQPDEVMEEAPLFTLVTTYLSYFILIIIGHIRDYFGSLFNSEAYKHLYESVNEAYSRTVTLP